MTMLGEILDFAFNTNALSGAFYLNRMVSDIFVEVCQDQKQFQHTVPLFWLRLVSALFQILDDRQGVR